MNGIYVAGTGKATALKCRLLIFCATAVLLATTSVMSQSSTPQATKLQGFLSDASGGSPVPATGTYLMTFSLYDADLGGTLIESFGPVPVLVTDGFYEQDLPFRAESFGDPQRYLELAVDGDPLAPRIQLRSSPYAFVAETLDGKDGAEFLDTSTTAQVKLGDLTVANLTATISIAGEGSGLTNLDANTLTSGTVPDARIAASITRDSEVPSLVSDVYVNVTGDRMTGSLEIVTGGLCVDIDGACDPPDGGVRVGPGGIHGADSASSHVILAPSQGNVGVGTATPSAKLEVAGDSRFTAPGIGLAAEVIPDQLGPGGAHLGGLLNIYNALGQRTIAFAADQWNYLPPFTNNGPRIILTQPDGNSAVVMGASGVSSGYLTVNGNVNAKIVAADSMTAGVLTIEGGADLSERFTVAERGSPLEKGFVVCIDPDNPGELTVSQRAYDRRVAGVLSGAGGVKPGMLMAQTGSLADGDRAVALSGRVYTWADASLGAIAAGDLLTTSDRSGHAMKVADHDRAQGAIIGKAMTPLEQGQGLVLVLVSLQ